MVISGTLCGWRRLGTKPRAHTLNSSFPCQSHCVGVHNVANLRWWSYSQLTFCCPPKITLMHLSKGLTHTSSVAMVWGLQTIVGAGLRGKARRDESRIVSYLSVSPFSGIRLILRSLSAHIPEQHLAGMSLKRDSVNMFQIWLEHAQDVQMGHLVLAFVWLQRLIRSPAHTISIFFHFPFLYNTFSVIWLKLSKVFPHKYPYILQQFFSLDLKAWNRLFTNKHSVHMDC